MQCFIIITISEFRGVQPYTLFLGSEGTLGIPESVAAAVVGFPTVQNAVDTVVMTLQCSLPMARMELLD